MENSYGSFVFYQTFYEAIHELPDDSQLRLYNAIVQFGLFGVESDLNVWEKAIFTQIRKLLLDNRIKRENGKKGGAPKGNHNAKKQPKTSGNKQKQANVNGNGNGNVNVDVKSNVPTVVGNTYARDSFFTTYGIAADAEPPPDTDFDKLSIVYSESTFLQNPNKPQFRRMSWILKNYAKLLAGHFKDYQKDGKTQKATLHKNKYTVETDIS